MDGGIGEMALMDAITSGAATGAAVGGGSALLTGGDPLQAVQLSASRRVPPPG